MKCPICGGDLTPSDEKFVICATCGAKIPADRIAPAVTEAPEPAPAEKPAEKTAEQKRLEELERRLNEMEAEKEKKESASLGAKCKAAVSKVGSWIKGHKKATAFSVLGLLAVIVVIVLCVSLCGVRGVYVNENNPNDYYVFTANTYTAVTDSIFGTIEEQGKWSISGGKLTLTIDDEDFGTISEDFDFKKVDGNDVIEIDGVRYKRVARSLNNKVEVNFDAGEGVGGGSNKIEMGTKLAEPTTPTRGGFIFLGWYDEEGHNYDERFNNWETVTYKAKWSCEEHPKDAIRKSLSREATCAEEGIKDIICSRCQNVIGKEIVPATGEHIYGNWETSTPATCLEDGIKTRHCVNCSAMENASIPSRGGHAYVVQTKKCYYCDDQKESLSSKDIIAFGEYPQRMKADEVKVTSVMDPRGYYLGSDGGYYADIRGEYYKVEPIRWRILEMDDQEVFLLCDAIIDAKRFDNDTNNYADSEIRTWLNGTFYDIAFSNVEKQSIKRETISNDEYSANPNNNPTAFNGGRNDYVCQDTQDKVFLPSVQDVTNSDYGFSDYSTSDPARKIIVTDYAKEMGVYTYHSSEEGVWWLRSPCYSGVYCAQYVYSYGGIPGAYWSSCSPYGLVDDSGLGIVPAIKMILS